LLDKFLSECFFSVEKFNETGLNIDRGKILSESELSKIKEFKRFAFSENGVSARALPGSHINGAFVAASDEHDEFGIITDEKENRVKMHEKRMKKLVEINEVLPKPIIYGNEDSEVLLVGWGSTKRPILEAMRLLEERKIKIKLMHLVYMFPFPTEFVKKQIEKAKIVIDIENNSTAQLNSLIRENCLIDIKNKILKFDGREFFPIALADEIEKLVKAK